MALKIKRQVKCHQNVITSRGCHKTSYSNFKLLHGHTHTQTVKQYPASPLHWHCRVVVGPIVVVVVVVVLTRKGGNYIDVFPFKAARRDRIWGFKSELQTNPMPFHLELLWSATLMPHRGCTMDWD